MANVHIHAGKLATARRWHPEDTDTIKRIEADLAEARVAYAIEQAVAAAPPSPTSSAPGSLNC